jgi:hypothetical protein
MLLTVIALTVGYLLVERRVRLRWLVVVLIAAAPIGWALHQHHASGRYSVGTSLDGINLHKGNNAGFLEHYPPQRGDSMDWYDSELNRGLSFSDEWSFNDHHQKAALDYLVTHPRETLAGDLRKVNVLFFAVAKYGGTASSGARRVVEDLGMLVFRLMLWTAILCAIYPLVRTEIRGVDRCVASWVFLCSWRAQFLPRGLCLYAARECFDLSGGAVLPCRLLCEQYGSSNT